MPAINLSLNTKKNKEGKHLILFDFRYQNKRYRLSTGVLVHERAWRGQRVDGRSDMNADIHNRYLEDGIKRLEQILLLASIENHQVDKEYLKENLKVRKSTDCSISLKEYFKHFKKKNAFRYSKGWLRKADPVKNHLFNFEPNLDWRLLTEDFWNRYTDYLVVDHSLAGVTIADHAKQIRTKAKAAKVEFPDLQIPQDAFQFSYKHHRPQQFWANWDEVSEIAQAHVLSKTEELVKSSIIEITSKFSYSQKFNFAG